MILKRTDLRKNLKRIISLMCVSVMSLGLICGCGVGTEDSTSEGIFYVTSTKEMRRLNFEKPNNLIEGAPNIYVVLKSTKTNYWRPLTDGVTRAGLECGCNIFMAGGLDYIKWDGQKKLLEEALEQGADAVVLAPESSSELSESIRQLQEAGIPVVLVDNCVNTDDYTVCYMTDNLKAGEEAARELYTMMKMDDIPETDELTVSLIIGNSDSQAVNERLAGFLQYWTQNAPKTWKTSNEIEIVNEAEDLAGDTARALLLNNPSIRAFYSADGSSSSGVAQMLMDNGRTDIYLACMDYSPSVASIISDPNYQAISIVQNQYDMGYRSVETARSLAYGNEINEKFVDTDTLTLRESNFAESSSLKEITQYKNFKNN